MDEPTTGRSTTIGVLGGQASFAGQAFSALAHARGDLRAAYAASLDELWGRLDGGGLEALLTTAETTHQGPKEAYRRLLAAPPLTYFVAAEVVVPYRCQLLGRPGTKLAEIQRVVGHGSLRECETELRELLPGTELAVSPKSTVHAAQEILSGDGTSAVVGTRQLAEDTGLEILVADVDAGSEGLWWVISTRPVPEAEPNRLVFRLGVGASGSPLARVMAAAGSAGWEVRTVCAEPARTELFDWRALVVLTHGAGDAELLPALADEQEVELLGAFRGSRDPRGREHAERPMSSSVR